MKDEKAKRESAYEPNIAWEDIPDNLGAKELSDIGPNSDLHIDPDIPSEPQPGAARRATSWRPANSLLVLRQQVNSRWPGRNKASDGMIGDRRHCGGSNPTSDHCARVMDGSIGVVTAFDITHDSSSCDAGKLASALIASRDPRIKYIISNGRITSSYSVGSTPPWRSRAYTGSNPHEMHMHLSVKPQKTGRSGYDSDAPWQIEIEGVS